MLDEQHVDLLISRRRKNRDRGGSQSWEYRITLREKAGVKLNGVARGSFSGRRGGVHASRGSRELPASSYRLLDKSRALSRSLATTTGSRIKRRSFYRPRVRDPDGCSSGARYRTDTPAPAERTRASGEECRLAKIIRLERTVLLRSREDGPRCSCCDGRDALKN